MSIFTLIDSRQVETRAALLGDIGSAANTTLNTVLSSVDTELTPPGSLTANSTMVVTVGPSNVPNIITGKVRSLPAINNVVIDFGGGSITFPSSSGTITTSTSTSAAITMGASQFCAVLVQLTNAGLINLVVGTPVSSLGAVVVPRGSSTALSLGYVILQTNLSSVIQAIAPDNVYQFVGGGGNGSGSGSGTASPASGFQFLVSDPFSESPTSTGSNVNSANTSASYQSSGPLYQMLCDKSQTITTSGAACTMSAAPAFTVTPGCIVWSNSQATWRKIVTVTSQTVYVLDSAFPVSLTSDSGMVAQAVFTNDVTMIGDSVHQHRGIDIFPSTPVQQINISYQDSSASGDAVFDAVSTAEVVVSAANNTTGGTNNGIPNSNVFASIFTRPSAPNSIPNYLLGGSGENLFLAFFPNPNNSAVTTQCNLLEYDCSLYSESVLNNGGYLNSAFVMTDGSGTPIDASVSTPATLTQITLTWSYTPGLNPGLPDGDLEVIVEGSIIPRYYAGVVGQYYTEITPNVIQLSANYSTSSYSVHIRRRQGSIDTSDANAQFIFTLTGFVFAYGGTNPPAGFLNCDGSAVSRSTYSALFNVIGTTYGAGDGSTTFNLPNTQGIFLRGAGIQTVSGKSHTATLGTTSADTTAANGLHDAGHSHGQYESNAGGITPLGANMMASGTAIAFWRADLGTQTHTSYSSLTGDAETAPANVAVNYIIKY